MRAAVLRNIGDETLEVRDDIELVDVQAGEVKVKIEATGVCHSDLSVMNGTIPQPPPCVLGHEGAGIVAEVGEGVTHVSPGDHVIVAWSPPCGTLPRTAPAATSRTCARTSRWSWAARPHFRLDGQPVFGMAGAGTFAEEMILPAPGRREDRRRHPARGRVARRLWRDDRRRRGHQHGQGHARFVGRRVRLRRRWHLGDPGRARRRCVSAIVAVDLVDLKLEDAQRFGATPRVKPDELDSVKAQVTGGDGFDYAFEAIGLPQTMRAAYDATRRGGTACIIGVGRLTEQVAFSAFELFFNEKNLVGSYYGSADVRTDFKRMLDLWKAGKLDLEGMITRRLGLDEINDAFQAMQKGEVIRQVISF